MAEADWTVLDDALGTGVIRRAPTDGVDPPPNSGSPEPFVYAFNSVATTAGATGFFCNRTNFAPMAKGGSIKGSMQRPIGGGPTGFSPMLFIGLQGPSVNDLGYLLGLSDGDPSRILLRKGTLAAGLGDLAPDPVNNGVLLRSTTTYARATWQHLRLDMIVNTNGDVRLQVYRNNLELHEHGTAPTWEAVPGMEEFVDDGLGINSGTPGFTSGRVGFAFRSADVTRRGYFTWLEVARQL